MTASEHLALRPTTLTECRRFVAEHHRHNRAPVTWLWGVGLEADGRLVGVAMAARPVARKLEDGYTIEIVRVCTASVPNGNSMLYGAVCRAAKALGWRSAITYTLESESGVSLRAAGFTVDAFSRPTHGWNMPSRPRVEVDLFGEELTPRQVAKIRWRRQLAEALPAPVEWLMEEEAL